MDLHLACMTSKNCYQQEALPLRSRINIQRLINKSWALLAASMLNSAGSFALFVEQQKVVGKYRT